MAGPPRFPIAVSRSVRARAAARREEPGRALVAELAEVRGVPRREIPVAGHVLALARPGLSGVEHLVGQPGAARRHLEPEDRIDAVLDADEGARQHAVEQPARVLDADSLPDPERPTHPAGVDEPARGAVPLELAAQEVGVDPRVVDHERRAEAGAEHDLRLRAETRLGAGDLRGVAGDEVVERLVGRQPRERREHALRVAGQEEDVARVAGHSRRHRVLDEVERDRRHACSRSTSRRRGRSGG